MIYDEERGTWYNLERGWRKRLVLRKVIFEGCRKFPSEDDFIFSDSSELNPYRYPPEPKTPQPE
jgi:hypothetical protein